MAPQERLRGPALAQGRLPIPESHALPVEASVTDFSLDTASIAIPFQKAVSRLQKIAFAEALWGRRLEVWASDPATQATIANRLGWLSAIEFVRPHVPRLRAFADAVRQEEFTDVVLLGMGGSSLAPEVRIAQSRMV